MHILYLSPEYPHQDVKHSAGIGTSLKNLTVALAAKGHTVTVVVYGQATDKVLTEAGVRIHLLAQRSYNILGWYRYRKFIQTYLNTVAKSERVDIIEAADWTGITAFMRLRVPLVIRLHGSDTYFCHLEKRKQKFKNHLFERLAMRPALGFIAPTQFAGQMSKELLKLKTQPRTIHYGLDLTRFKNDAPSAFEQGLILYIGTLIRKKGVLELPSIMRDVWQKHPKSNILLIGADAPDVESGNHSTIRLIKDQLSIVEEEKFFFPGKIPYEKVAEYIRRANVCVFPTFAETLGMVTIECMAMQKAVVNSDIGWSKELLVDGKSGFLVFPKDHGKFAMRINSLLSDSENCVAMGKNASEHVATFFDINKIVHDNVRYYNEIINGKT